jgi:cell wall-associated NlpC family hydrolase
MFEVLRYAKAQINVPYKWGGDNPLEGFDCSGFVQWVLASVGLDPEGDQTAQTLYNHFKLQGEVIGKLEPGALVFYGPGRKHIKHVAIGIDRYRVIEAGGGDRTTQTHRDACKKGACVRERLYDHRKDLVVIIKPDYHTIGNALNL